MADATDTPTSLAEPTSMYDELKSSAKARWNPVTARASASASLGAEPPAPSPAPGADQGRLPARAVAPAVDVTAWDVPPGAPASNGQPSPQPSAAVTPAAAPLTPAPATPASDPLAPAEVAQEVAGIVSGRREQDPEAAVMQGFLDDLAAAPHVLPESTGLVEEASGSRAAKAPASVPASAPASAPAASPIFIPGNTSSAYTDYVQPVTEGVVTMLINGRDSGALGPDVNRTEPLDHMQDTVQSLGSGDLVYLSAWFFGPDTKLTRAPYLGATTWGGLFAKKADEGVVIRILINDFDPVSTWDQWLQAEGLDKLDPIVTGLKKPDNLKYVVTMHPAHVGPIKGMIVSGTFRDVHVASHHQKFMVCRHGSNTIAFCGGVDIEARKTPAEWGYPPSPKLIAWHDLHVKLEGPIARDLHKEFVMRWNREKDSSRTPALPGWSGYEALAMPAALTAADPDNQAAKKRHKVQMLRTVSSNAAMSMFATNRDDIRQVYRLMADSGRDFLYFENQYFRSLGFADRLVAAAAANPGLVAIFVVVASAAADDGENALTAHGAHLQHEFFKRVTTAFGSRAAVYTMVGRSVHSKFFMADDRWMCVGSANLNDRSFELDSELNVAVDDTALVRATRKRLWAHDLGVPEATVDTWAKSDFISQWDAVASANLALAVAGQFAKMAGEGVVAYDWSASTGTANPAIPDVLARFDFDGNKELAGTPRGPSVMLA